MSASNVSSRPFRFSVEWVSAEADRDEAQVAFESVVDWIARGGGFVQGGLVQQMEETDVIAKSPLYHALRRPAA